MLYILALATFTVASLLDMQLTSYGIARGLFQEGNPFMALFVGNPAAFLAVKVASVAVVGACAFAIGRLGYRRLGGSLLWLAAVGQLAVCAWNFLLVTGGL